ncbi:hypothetical protein LINPERPRIM_LOCUS8625 [Linum perenne]
MTADGIKRPLPTPIPPHQHTRQEELESSTQSALGGKKSEFEKWGKEIKKREQANGGDSSGGRGIFGIYLVLIKGEVMVAVVFNPLLRTLRGTRDGLTSISSKFGGGFADVGETSSKEACWCLRQGESGKKMGVGRRWCEEGPAAGVWHEQRDK